MFASIPVRVWLLILLAVFAIPPAIYVHRYVTHSDSSLLDMSRPREDLSWRTPGRLYVNLAILAALAGLAAFSFSPMAAQLATQGVQSSTFVTVAMLGCGVWALSTVPRGLMDGQIEPIVRGFHEAYGRETAPRRYWASVAWNGLFGALCLFLGFKVHGQRQGEIVESQCYNQREVYTPQDQLEACNQLLADPRESGDRAWILGERGVAFHRAKNFRHALADYDAALRLNPRDPDTYYNRGLVDLELHDTEGAVADFSKAIELRPDFDEALFSRGYTFEHVGDLPRAIADFTAVIRLRPTNIQAYYYRAAANQDLGNDDLVAADVAAVERIDPKAGEAMRYIQTSTSTK